MIAYEELVAALTNWRMNQGLPTGASDFLGEPPPPPPVHAFSQSEDDYLAADDMVIDDEHVGAEHLGTGDSTDTVDVSEIEVLGDDVYDEQRVDDDDEPQTPPPYESGMPLSASAEFAPPPIVDLQPSSLRMETETEGEATMVASDDEDDATKVADEQATPAPDDAHAARQTLDTDMSEVIPEYDLPPIPAVGGAAHDHSDSTIDIDLGAEAIEVQPAVSGELGGKPKPE